MMSQHAHESLGQLLPWYANGSLDPETRESVASHLEQCAACRNELAFLGDVRAVLRVAAARDDDAPVARNADFRSLPPELQQRVLAAPPPRARRTFWMPALAAGFLSAVGLGVALGVTWLDAPRYRTAASGGGAGERTQVAVTFAPGASLQQLNAVLREHNAVIVNAPATGERWLLEVPATGSGASLLAHLRTHAGVIDAETVTAGAATE